MASENRMLSDEKRNLETRLNHTESELNVCEMTKEHLRNDKTIVSTCINEILLCILLCFSNILKNIQNYKKYSFNYFKEEIIIIFK